TGFARQAEAAVELRVQSRQDVIGKSDRFAFKRVDSNLVHGTVSPCPLNTLAEKRRMSLSWRDLCSKTQFAVMNDTSNAPMVIRDEEWKITKTSRWGHQHWKSRREQPNKKGRFVRHRKFPRRSKPVVL